MEAKGASRSSRSAMQRGGFLFPASRSSCSKFTKFMYQGKIRTAEIICNRCGSSSYTHALLCHKLSQYNSHLLTSTDLLSIVAEEQSADVWSISATTRRARHSCPTPRRSLATRPCFQAFAEKSSPSRDHCSSSRAHRRQRECRSRHDAGAYPSSPLV